MERVVARWDQQVGSAGSPAGSPAEKCHSFTVTMFHSHPAEVVDEYFGKCDGEKYEIVAWEKYL